MRQSIIEIMKTIRLERIKLRNFKGVENLEIDFNDQVTDIRGRNGSGKTSIVDAFNWLLYGKDSHGRTDFGIKTLNTFGKVIPKLEHEVEGVIFVDGETITLKRVYLEKWQTKRGNDFEELTGHEVKYYVDEVPTSAADYKNQVEEILNETISKAITNLRHFNESLGWKERRVILETMAGGVSDESIIESSEESLDEVQKILDEGKTLDGEKAKINEQRKKTKQELKEIPSRIDEVDRSKPEARDFNAIDERGAEISKEIEQTIETIEDKSKGLDVQRSAINEAKNAKFEKEQKLNELRQEQLKNSNREGLYKSKNELKEKQAKIVSERESKERQITTLEGEVRTLTQEASKYREEWHEADSKQFNEEEVDTCCPTCKRELDNAQDKIEELRNNFNKDKTEKLEKIKAEGVSRKNKITAKNNDIERLTNELFEDERLQELEKSIAEIDKELEKPQGEIKETDEMLNLKDEIDAIVIPEIVPVDDQELKSKLSELTEELETINKQLEEKTQIDRANKRIAELQEKQRALSQELSSMDRVLIQIDAFNALKIELIEGRVNDKFATVTFKMFDEQINGGYSDACECMIDGVPYSDLNTASRVNASLDIIRALQMHYEILAPVFVDNKESVTDLARLQGQLITLTVDPDHYELTKV